MKIAGILMVIAGLAAIFVGGFSYTSHNRAAGAVLIQAAETENHPVRIPPMLGVAGILAGAGLFFFRLKQGR